MEKPILKTQGVKKYFKGSSGGLFGRKSALIKAVDDVSLKIMPQETFGLVGESGCGKSTLGKTMMGIYRPTEGKVSFKGRDITGLSRAQSLKLRKEIQYVYQDSTISLDPHWKIRNILAEPLIVHTGMDKPAIRDKVNEILEEVGLGEEHLNLYPHEFSGGQQRRLGLARILCLNPAMLILDEPTSGLDVSVQATILNLLMSLKERFRLTYVFISHNLSVVRMICHRVGVMYAGQIVELGDTAEVFANPLHPYTKVLLSAIPALGVPFKGDASISGEPPNPEKYPPGCRFEPRCALAVPDCRTNTEKLVEVSPGRFVACRMARNS